MTEIEQIKGVLDSHLKAYTEGNNDKADHLDKLIEEKSIDWLSSLITTIESQEEKLKSRNILLAAMVDHVDTVNARFESQKEEIEKLKSYQVIKNYTDMLVECNSYKAITELAVKWLDQVMQHAVTGSAAFNVAVSVSKQIERLQNEKP